MRQDPILDRTNRAWRLTRPNGVLGNGEAWYTEPTLLTHVKKRSWGELLLGSSSFLFFVDRDLLAAVSNVFKSNNTFN